MNDQAIRDIKRESNINKMMRLENTLTKADTMLALKDVKVRLSFNEDNNKFEAVNIRQQNDVKEIERNLIAISCPHFDIIRIKGLNYHELGHVIYTHFLKQHLNEAIVSPKLMDAMNILEDCRVENLMAVRFGKTVMNYLMVNRCEMYRPKFEKSLQNTTDGIGIIGFYLIGYGIKFIPTIIKRKFRKMLIEWMENNTDKWNMKDDKSLIAKEMIKSGEKLINRYIVAQNVVDRFQIAKEFTNLFRGCYELPKAPNHQQKKIGPNNTVVIGRGKNKEEEEVSNVSSQERIDKTNDEVDKIKEMIEQEQKEEEKEEEKEKEEPIDNKTEEDIETTEDDKTEDEEDDKTEDEEDDKTEDEEDDKTEDEEDDKTEDEEDDETDEDGIPTGEESAKGHGDISPEQDMKDMLDDMMKDSLKNLDSGSCVHNNKNAKVFKDEEIDVENRFPVSNDMRISSAKIYPLLNDLERKTFSISNLRKNGSILDINAVIQNKIDSKKNRMFRNYNIGTGRGKLRVMIVIDNSGSMNKEVVNNLSKLSWELHNVLTKHNHQCEIISFGSEVKEVKVTNNYYYNMGDMGGTVFEGINPYAVEFFEGASSDEGKLLIVFTDGGFNGDYQRAYNLLKYFNALGVTIWFGFDERYLKFAIEKRKERGYDVEIKMMQDTVNLVKKIGTITMVNSTCQCAYCQTFLATYHQGYPSNVSCPYYTNKSGKTIQDTKITEHNIENARNIYQTIKNQFVKFIRDYYARF